MSTLAIRLCKPCRQRKMLPGLFFLRKWSASRGMSQKVSFPHHSVQVFRPLEHCKFLQSRGQVMATLCCPFSSSSHQNQAASDVPDSGKEQLISQMNIRLVNENSFLSWCRNAYLSTVVGVAMMAEGVGGLAQSAGLGALLVGTMNLAWGTGCHVTNLIRLRHVSGMSGFTLFLHLAGSSLHCFLWAFVLICYIGFLDETRWPAQEEGMVPSRERGDNKSGLRKV
ncbi:transmembrane protein 160 [Plakobranchus ocellatus]|uniref:Transmembrane protein 160 n=1 Tax=Plakobranchus ocellatus TaxID=259542 RepID=A0AAV4ADC6_9GAST|nr:transmembrane protein 160 [Plakobranchus ocellatus]